MTPLRLDITSDEQLASEEERPDARVHLTTKDGEVLAQAALWWRETPLLDGERVGTIGDFSADDADAADRLLADACAYLRKAGCKVAVGPMNGNTWRRHRFVVESSGRGPFLLEPRNPMEWPGWWERAGFSVLSRYSSSLIRLAETEVIPAAVKIRLERTGVMVRSLNLSRYEDELKLIHAVSLRSFAQNFLYTPLEEEAFLTDYQKVRGQVDDDFVRIAERDRVPCGFVFSIADLEAAACGEKPAIIVKTLAVDPEARCAGLGSLLVDEIHQAGREKGFTDAIHALQHGSNSSLKITDRHRGQVFRRYALFHKRL